MTTTRIGNLVIHEGQTLYPVAEQDRVVTLTIENSRHSKATVSLQELRAALGDDPMRLLAERRKRKGLIDPEKFGQAEKDRILYSGVL